MITYTTAETTSELKAIIDLQRANLAQSLTASEAQSQGFVTAVHGYEYLKKYNEIERHVIAKDAEQLVAYVLTMTKASKFDIPALFHLFGAFDNTLFEGAPIASYNYMLVGQVCVHKAYRGQGIFDESYQQYKNRLSERYDFAVTGIAAANLRSQAAHKRVGFQELCRYRSTQGAEWCLVLWDWRK